MTEKTYNYTYVLIDASNKLYIGVHSDNRLPKEDGYMGSASDKSYKPIAKHVLRLWPTREEAMAHEIRLHNEFNAGVNKQFANRAKATTDRFCTAGIIHSIERRLRQSKILTGRTLSESHKNSISVSGKRKQLGKIRSADTKANMSAAHIGQPLSEYHRAQISAGGKGRIFSENHKTNLSKALKSKPIAEDTKLKISISLKNKPVACYIWQHPNFGSVESTIDDLIASYSISRKSLGKLKNNKLIQVKGWTCIACVLPQR